jgi:hypothetical protein
MFRGAIIAVAGLLIIPSLLGQAGGEEPAPAVVRAGEHRLPFQVHDGLIYIQARVNGQRATLLVDTGAALTIFTLRVVPTLNTDSRVTINMAKGSVVASRLNVGFVLGDPELRERHCSFHQNVVVGAFQFLNADGVVGYDVLSRFESVAFDFKNSTLILEDR